MSEILSIPAPFQIPGLAGYRYEIVGMSAECGIAIVTSIVTDSPSQARAELDEILTDRDYAGWYALYAVPYSHNGDLGAFRARDAVRIR